MKADRNLDFLRGKIVQTGTALCSIDIPGLSDTAYIVHTNTVDEEGNISFNLVDTFPVNMRYNLQSFAIKLFYYKKGLGYFMNIQAIASAHNTSSISTNGKPENEPKLLTIKARIMAAEYNERFKPKSEGIIASFKKKLSQVAAAFFMF